MQSLWEVGYKQVHSEKEGLVHGLLIARQAWERCLSVKSWAVLGSPRRRETWEKKAGEGNEVGHGIRAKDAKARLNYFPTCSKVQLAIRKPMLFLTEEQPQTFWVNMPGHLNFVFYLPPPCLHLRHTLRKAGKASHQHGSRPVHPTPGPDLFLVRDHFYTCLKQLLAWKKVGPLRQPLFLF